MNKIEFFYHFFLLANWSNMDKEKVEQMVCGIFKEELLWLLSKRVEEWGVQILS